MQLELQVRCALCWVLTKMPRLPVVKDAPDTGKPWLHLLTQCSTSAPWGLATLCCADLCMQSCGWPTDTSQLGQLSTLASSGPGQQWSRRPRGLPLRKVRKLTDAQFAVLGRRCNALCIVVPAMM